MKSKMGIIISIIVLITLVIFFILMGLLIGNNEKPNSGYQEKVLIVRFDENETLKNIQNLTVELEEQFPHNTIYYFEYLTEYTMILSIEEDEDGVELSEFINNNSDSEIINVEYRNIITIWHINDP